MTANLACESRIFKGELLKMTIPNSEDRAEVRFDHIAPLQVKDLRSGEIYEARMQNYSNDGMYFESDGCFEKGTRIHVCIQNSPYVRSSGVLEYYTGEVRWRQELNQPHANYGYGIQLISGSSSQDTDSKSSNSSEELRKHPRKPYFKSVQFSTVDRIHNGVTRNVSRSGVFIATDEKLEVGQSLKLNLPLNEGKIAKIIGKIVWLNEQGFGLKFKRVN
jgi:Tfp pilus assembly protein PilZ